MQPFIFLVWLQFCNTAYSKDVPIYLNKYFTKFLQYLFKVKLVHIDEMKDICLNSYVMFSLAIWPQL